MFGKFLNQQISPADSVPEKPKPKPKSPESSKVNLNVLRNTLFLSLLLTAVLGGYFSYHSLNDQEKRIEEISFHSTTTQIQDVSTNSITAKIKSLNSFRVFLKSNCPTLQSWPHCTMDQTDYNTFANGFIVAADIATCNHEALVTSNELHSFVTHAEGFYHSAGYSDVANVVQGGVFVVNDTTFEVYKIEKPDTRGENSFILPILQIVNPHLNFGALMFNIYSGTDRIPLIDAIYSCVRSIDPNQAANFTIDDIGERCMVVTKVIKVVEDIEFRPAVVMMYPIMLQVDNISTVDSNLIGNKTTIEVNGQFYVHVGSLSAIFYWDQVLTKSVSQKTHGLDILLNDGSSDFYYTFVDGIAVYKPDKTFTDESRLRVSFPITTTLENSDFVYTLTIQVDDIFSSRYYTNGPIFSSILYMSAIVFCITIYYFYDLQTDKKWAQNDQAKRNFVRYISHEIRTPLTTVSLGIKLVMKELRSLQRMTLPSVKDIPYPCRPFDKLPQKYPVDDVIGEHQEVSIMATSTLLAPDTKAMSRTKPNAEGVIEDSLGVLESVEGSVEVAVLILTDLLNYDKIQNGSLDISCEFLNACKLVNEVGESFQVAAQAASITLDVKNNVTMADNEDADSINRKERSNSIDSSFRKVFNFAGGATKAGIVETNDIENLHPIAKAPPPPLILFGDGVKLHQVLRNLISNAIKFTPMKGSVTITSSWNKKSTTSFKTEMKSTDGSVEYTPVGSFIVTVQDSGVGLSAENLKQVFSDGWQFNANQLQGGQGSGLGLWITKSIVELHHGTLSCYSDGAGSGCTMQLELPVLLRMNAEVVDSLNGVSATHPPQGLPVLRQVSNMTKVFDFDIDDHCGGGKTILVVDDSIMCRKMVCRLLRNMSYECVEANNGAECVEKLNASDGYFTFVLLDFEMPIMNGPTACKILRENGHTMPVIGLTGNVLKVDVDYFVQCGATAVIAKPFSLEEFIDTIKHY